MFPSESVRLATSTSVGQLPVAILASYGNGLRKGSSHGSLFAYYPEKRLGSVPKKTYAPLTQEFVRSILDYDPETGIFTWRERPYLPQKWNSRYAGKIAGNITRYGYVRIQIGKGLHYPAHVLAWLHVFGEWLPDGLDHRQGVRGDNRIKELRRADNSDNACNKAMQRNNKSGFVGVHFVQQAGKWEGVISKNGKRIWRYFFPTPEAAHKARQKELARIHGEFSVHEPIRARYFHSRDSSKS